jgi:hypothetical protein
LIESKSSEKPSQEGIKRKKKKKKKEKITSKPALKLHQQQEATGAERLGLNEW